MPAVPDYLTNPPSLFAIPQPGQVQQGLFQQPDTTIPDALRGIGMANNAWKLGNGISNLWDGTANIGGTLANLGSAAGGAAMSHFFGQKAHNAGGQIGGAAGAVAGSFVPIPVLGTFAGAELGKAIGGMFGPRKSVGPGGTWGYDFRSGQPVGVSGDNGWVGGELAQPGAESLSYLDGIMRQYGGTLGADAVQFGAQPMQGHGSPQVAFTGAGGRMGGGDWMGNGQYNLGLDSFNGDFIRSAIGSGALQVTPEQRQSIFDAIGGEQSPLSLRAQQANDAHNAYLQNGLFAPQSLG